MPRSRDREVWDLEDHMATLSRHLELLAALARNATTDAARRRIAGEIAACRRDFDRLRRRRQQLTSDTPDRDDTDY